MAIGANKESEMKQLCTVVLSLGLALSRPATAEAAGPRLPPNPNVLETITCADMRRDPTAVFSRTIDLGSSIYTPTDIDYDCEESLSQRPFLTRLLRLAEDIRGVRRACGMR